MSYSKPKPLSECKTIVDFAYRERYVFLTECEAFFLHFRVPLKKFWLGNIMGFDILAFDKWLECGERSCSEVVLEKYGQDAVNCVKRIIHMNEGD